MIKDILIKNFKIIKNKKFNFHPNLNLIIGPNGSGKTSLLEAIYYSFYFRSFSIYNSKFLINKYEDFLFIETNFIKEGLDNNIKVYYDGIKKNILLNDNNIKKISEVYSILNVIVFSHYDFSIIENKLYRDRFFYKLISFYRMDFLDYLNKYKKILNQKRILLKSDNLDIKLLDIYNKNLIELSEKLSKIKEQFLKEYINIFNSLLKKLEIKKKFSIDIYKFKNKEYWEELFSSIKEKEIEDKKILEGFHKEDINFYKDNIILKNYSSEGEKKLFIFLLKYSEFLLYKKKTNNIIFLFDDIISLYDEKNRNLVFNLIKEIDNYQKFITSTELIDYFNSKKDKNIINLT